MFHFIGHSFLITGIMSNACQRRTGTLRGKDMFRIPEIQFKCVQLTELGCRVASHCTFWIVATLNISCHISKRRLTCVSHRFGKESLITVSMLSYSTFTQFSHKMTFLWVLFIRFSFLDCKSRSFDD